MGKSLIATGCVAVVIIGLLFRQRLIALIERELAMKHRMYVLTAAILICALFRRAALLMERADIGKPAAEETAEVCPKEITQPEKLAEAKKYDIAGISFDAVKAVESEAIAEVLDSGIVLVIYDVNDEKLSRSVRTSCSF